MARPDPRPAAPLAALLLALLAAAACGDTTSSPAGSAVPACVPGKAEACPCPAGPAAGVQTCRADGTFGACACEPPGGDAGSDDGSPGGADADAALADGGPDDAPPGTPPDTAVGPVGAACDPCGYGGLKGLVCAPSKQQFVPQAKVTVTGVDCDGEERSWETLTDAGGLYAFDALPCGRHEVHVSAGSFETTYEVDVEAGTLNDVTGAGYKLCFKAGSVRLAVLSGQWDHLDQLLDELGLLYDHYPIDAESCRSGGKPEEDPGVSLLRDPLALAKYDAVFFNCGSAPVECVERFPEIKQHLAARVLDGMSMYGSDRAWAYVEGAFPGAIDFWGSKELTNDVAKACGRSLCGFDTGKYPDGVPVESAIVDGALAAYAGAEGFVATYGPGPLVAIEGVGEGTTVHVRGNVKLDIPSGLFKPYTEDDEPLVVSFRPGPGAGRVVYTTFHNDEQADDLMKSILYYLVFLL